MMLPDPPQKGAFTASLRLPDGPIELRAQVIIGLLLFFWPRGVARPGHADFAAFPHLGG